MLLAIEHAPYGDLLSCREKLMMIPGDVLKLKLSLDLARGLRDLHSTDGLRFIHRDVRGPNIFIFSLDESTATADSLVVHGKLGDFGTVVVATPTYSSDAETWQYASPETIMTGLLVPFSQSVDVYSFGILMWEIFSCEVPFLEYMMKNDVAKRKIMNGFRPFIDSNRISPDVADVLNQCWDGQPERRPSFPTIIDQLTTILNKRNK